MKTDDNLDLWWNSIDLKGLMRMFVIKPGQDANDFIEDCDAYWWALTPDEKYDFYQRHFLDAI